MNLLKTQPMDRRSFHLLQQMRLRDRHQMYEQL
jgi:hypothetical protein